MYIQKGEYMKNNKSRFIVILLMLSMVAVACGGDTAEEVVETIIQDVINYMANEEKRDDDITLIAVKVI